MTCWWPVAASGRNSGVLYAGFYCLSDSLKAKLTRDGNRQLADYCDERGLDVNRCDKLVVAKNADEFPVLDEQLARAMKKIEPNSRKLPRRRPGKLHCEFVMRFHRHLLVLCRSVYIHFNTLIR